MMENEIVLPFLSSILMCFALKNSRKPYTAASGEINIL